MAVQNLLSQLKLLVLVLLLCAPAYCQDDNETDSKTNTENEQNNNPFSGDIGVTSNYVYRGISASNNNPAVQGGFTISDTLFHTGTYFNVWSSSGHFPDEEGHTGRVELDLTAGVANDIGNNFSYDIRGARYIYPNTRGLAYNEIIGDLYFYFLKAELAYSNDIYATDKVGIYYNLGIEHEFPEEIIKIKGLKAGGGIGHFSLPESAGLHSYDDYRIFISKDFEIWNNVSSVLMLEWTGTNGKSVDPSRLSKDHIVASFIIYF